MNNTQKNRMAIIMLWQNGLVQLGLYQVCFLQMQLQPDSARFKITNPARVGFTPWLQISITSTCERVWVKKNKN